MAFKIERERSNDFGPISVNIFMSTNEAKMIEIQTAIESVWMVSAAYTGIDFNYTLTIQGSPEVVKKAVNYANEYKYS